MKKISYSKILTIQIVLNIVFTLLIFNQIGIFFFIFQEIILILVLFLKKKNIYLSVVFLPFIFMYTYGLILYTIAQTNLKLTLPIYIVYFTGTLLILIPVVKEKFGKIKQELIRLISLIWLVLISIHSVGIFPIVTREQNELLYAINASGILYAFVTFICVYILLKLWGHDFHFNLHVKNTGMRYYGVLLLSLLFIIWYTFFSIFLGLAQSSNEIFNNWNVSLINPDYSAKYINVVEIVLNSLDPAIYEEVERYGYIIILLVIFKSKKYQMQGAIFISALLFSLSHIGNFFTTDMSFNDVISQTIVAFGLGCFLAVMLLYTGKVWINILIHFSFDFLVFSITDIGYLTVSIFNKNNGWLLKSSIELCILLFATFIFAKFNKKILKMNIEELI
ncbi:protease [Lactobacillus paragasseri]|uniref:CPBP family intramembrane glutamic endopeptidase n=1 Tax=Lactobacillus paragasseri TaxID=2107999 RepID=UPI001CC7A7E0|nr:CPBP family intramembrane glutamic endopeptidase [Lactobacillus paragasseri]GIL33442.1 protease [Lactobacillus paragasseri]